MDHWDCLPAFLFLMPSTIRISDTFTKCPGVHAHYKGLELTTIVNMWPCKIIGSHIYNDSYLFALQTSLSEQGLQAISEGPFSGEVDGLLLVSSQEQSKGGKRA